MAVCSDLLFLAFIVVAQFRCGGLDVTERLLNVGIQRRLILAVGLPTARDN
jgi:hypothetical protein